MKTGFKITFFCLVLHMSYGQTVVLQNQKSHYGIGKQVEYLIDTTTRLSLSQIQRQHFTKSQSDFISLKGYKWAYWFRFTIDNQSDEDLTWLFEHAFTHAFTIDFYEFDKQGQLVQKILTGDARGNSGRPLATTHYSFPLKIKARQTHLFYVKFGEVAHPIFPFYIWEQKAFYEKEYFDTIVLGLYFGIILSFLLYYLILFFYHSQKSYGYFILFMLFFCLVELFRANGELITRYITAKSTNSLSLEGAVKISHFLILIASSWSLLLYSHISQLEQYSKSLFKASRVLMAVFGLFFLCVLFEIIPIHRSLSLQTVSPILGYSFFIPINIVRIRQGHQPSLYLLYSSLAFFVGILIYSTYYLGYSFNDNFWLAHSLNIGYLIEILFLSFAFASSTRQERLAYLANLENANAELLQKNEAIKASLLEGQILERKRVERELHDGLGSVLFGVRASLFGIQHEKLTDNQLKSYQNVEGLLLRAEREVKLIAHNQFPPELEEKGLITALIGFVEDLNGLKVTDFRLQTEGFKEELDSKTRFELFSIVRELAANILKHARATEAVIGLHTLGETILLVAQDNGLGFDPSRKYKGLGMKNLSHRVETELRGQVLIESGKEGTKVSITVPIVDGS